MKLNFTSLFLTVAAMIITASSFAQTTGDYRTVSPAPNPGNWSDIANWERYDGASWVAAPSAPTSADGAITIRTGAVILLNLAVTADQLTVETGATLSVNQGAGFNLTLNNGAGDDLVVTGTINLGNAKAITGAGNFVLNGTFNWTDGTLSAPTTTALGSVTNLSGNVTKNLNASFTNGGTFNWATGASAGGINFNNGSLINNGTINEQFQSDRGFTIIGGTNSFVNNGVFNKTTTFQFFSNNLPSTNSVTGTLQGVGNFNFNLGTFTNNGIVAPGSSPGLLNINAGSISAQNTSLNIEVVNGSGAGVGHDVLNLTTSGPFVTNLTSVTLNVTEPGLSAPFQSYTILTTTGTFSGTFAAANIPSGYSITYNAASVVVTKLAFPLPAVWGDFAALSKGNAVTLNWKTLQESNTSHFAVQHSTDGKNYTTVTSVAAQGNSDLTNAYSFVHRSPNTKGNNFYRLQLVDKDAKIGFSPVRVVRYSNGQVKALVITPNPVSNLLNLSVQERVEMKLTDMNGRILKTQVLAEGNHSIDVSSLQPGVYVLNAYKEGALVETQRVVKQ